MVKAKKYVVTKRFEGLPKLSDYKLVEVELPPLKNGEILVKTEVISLDPSYRIQFGHTNNMQLFKFPYDQMGYQVGVVQESKNAQFPVGTHVVSYKGWTDYYIGDPNAPVESIVRDRIIKVPNLKGLPYSYAIGAVGMPGASAYLGLLKEIRINPGETVVVTGAAGAVGSIVGQIAKVKGCRVIGFAGSDDKVKWLEDELGFDKAYNYKKVNITNALKEGAPKGVDVYFDNVGGEITTLIMREMNTFGRVCVCGCISSYNETVLPKATIVQFDILKKTLKVNGFGVYYYDEAAWEEAFNDLVDWIKDGHIKVREHVVEGFDKVREAFIGMLSGENVGKAIVKI